MNAEPPRNDTPLDERSRQLRAQIVRTFGAARRGHLASAFSMVEMLRVLYDDILNFRAGEPRAADRDRCVFSKGHGCLALYAVLADKGFIGDKELDGFCQFEGTLGGHPEFGKIPGVEASTGSLGHGLSIAVGMALALRIDRNPAHVFAVISDGECNEGSTWEAALCAAKHRPLGITALLDYNRQQSYGQTCEVLDLEPLSDKWAAFGWHVRTVDGHDVSQVREATRELRQLGDGPGVVICKTIKGKGVSYVENSPKWHHKNRVTDEELDQLLDQLGVAHA